MAVRNDTCNWLRTSNSMKGPASRWRSPSASVVKIGESVDEGEAVGAAGWVVAADRAVAAAAAAALSPSRTSYRVAVMHNRRFNRDVDEQEVVVKTIVGYAFPVPGGNSGSTDRPTVSGPVNPMSRSAARFVQQ